MNKCFPRRPTLALLSVYMSVTWTSVCVCVCDDEEFTEQRAAIYLSDINAEVYGLRAH